MFPMDLHRKKFEPRRLKASRRRSLSLELPSEDQPDTEKLSLEECTSIISANLAGYDGVIHQWTYRDAEVLPVKHWQVEHLWPWQNRFGSSRETWQPLKRLSAISRKPSSFSLDTRLPMRSKARFMAMPTQ